MEHNLNYKIEEKAEIWEKKKSKTMNFGRIFSIQIAETHVWRELNLLEASSWAPLKFERWHLSNKSINHFENFSQIKNITDDSGSFIFSIKQQTQF